MSGKFDRKAYCKAVGIHRSTLSRWVTDGIVEPKYEVVPPPQDKPELPGRRQQIFTQDQVIFGRALIHEIRKYRGQYALWEMAEIVRGQRERERFTRGPRSSGEKS